MTGIWPIDTSLSDMSRRLGFFKNLQRVANKIHATQDSDEVLLEMSEDICELFHCDRLTIYALAPDRQSIVAKIKTGLASHQTIRLPISHDSLAGHVAATGRTLNIRDVYDDLELAGHSRQLRFLREIDQRTGYRTRQVLVAPILDPANGGLLGVVQLINNRSDAPFPTVAEEGIQALAQTLAVALVRHRQLTPPAPSSNGPSEAAVPSLLDDSPEYVAQEGVSASSEHEIAPIRSEDVVPGMPTTENLAASNSIGGEEDERLLLETLVAAHRQEASHIHIEPGSNGESSRVRFRRQGTLSVYAEPPSRRGAAWVRHLKGMARLDLVEEWRPQEGWISSARWEVLPIDLRVITLPTAAGIEDVVLHLRPHRNLVPLEDLGFDLANLKRLQGLFAQARGLFLICGPAACGKTTVQHAILAHLNRPEKKIWVAPSVAPLSLKGVRQMTIRSSGRSDIAAMKDALRHADADILALDELRDQETVALAVDAALAGHLVLARLRAASVAQALRHLFARGIDGRILSNALLGILARRRVKRLCPACKEAYESTAEERSQLFEHAVFSPNTHRHCDPAVIEALARWRSSRYAEDRPLTLYRARGCAACEGRGYQGFVALHELLPAGDWPQRQLLERFSDGGLLPVALQEGWPTLETGSIDRILSGETDLASIHAAPAL